MLNADRDAWGLLSDAELATSVVNASTAGHRAAEAELCRRFGRRVRSYGRSRLSDSSAVDDLVQRVMLLVITKLRQGQVQAPERIGSFVLGTARLVTLEMARSHEQPKEFEAELSCPLAETRPDFLELARLGECLKSLSERDRSVVSLTFFHEQSADDVAQALGMQAGNVRVARHRALSRLKSCMGLGAEEASA